MTRNGFSCEACEGNQYKDYEYPVGWEKRLEIEKQKLTFKKVTANNLKYVAKTFISLSPRLGMSRFDDLRERAAHRQWLSRSQIDVLARNLQFGASFFEGRMIQVCQDCGFGAVNPPLSEQKLTEYYSGVYWLAMAKALEPCENPRTTTIYELVEQQIEFGSKTNCMEFGSASAQLSRYFQLRQPHLDISVIEPGDNWRRLLQGRVKSVFSNIHEASGTYDLFVASHSLEHVPDTREYFPRIVDLVAENGYLIFEVPNSIEADVIFDKANLDYHIPHTYFFTPSSFEKLAGRYGLKVLVMKTFNRSYSQILNNVQNGVNGTMENPDGAYLRVLLQKAGSADSA